jgi:Bifunctional DNA primase/polymerase, N-terminal/Protein of unknown function (DUF3987)
MFVDNCSEICRALPLDSVLGVALDCIKRGWHVFPCWPRSKKPMTHNGFKDATINEEQIRLWWASSPDANVAIATGPSGLCVVDLDEGVSQNDVSFWMLNHGLPGTYAVRTGRRSSFGLQLYYAGSGLQSTGWSLPDGSKGDIRCATGYVMAAGSIHPDSKQPYEVWRSAPIVPVPDSVLSLTSAAKNGSTAVTVDDEKADAWKEWLLRFIEGCSMVWKGYEKRVPNGWWLGVRCPWEESHGSGPGVDSSTVLGILDGNVAFECSHGSCKAQKHDTAAFRGLFGDFPVEPGAPPEVLISSKTAIEVNTDEFEAVEDTARPVYPDSVWDGTPYGEFADYCTTGNFIPKRFFSESLRTVVCSVVGNQLSTDYQGVNARAYTVLIGPPGSGKGTAITAARQFVECEVDSQRCSSERPLLWADNHDSMNWCWPSRNIGAHVVSPASAPGLIQATRPHKLEKGESRNAMELWNPLPRFITIQEEIGGLFANFANENSGRGLEAAILELYDRDSFTTTATNERSAKSGCLLYSILGGIPKTEWDDIFARSTSVGSGLFSRLNIIGTENTRTVAGLPEYDFTEMQRRFLPRITALERTPARIPVSPNARGLLNEWFARLSDEMKNDDLPSARLNLHALRVALHQAWLRGHANILESDIDAGIKVAAFQAKMRDFYRPAEGETREAQWEARIMKAMKSKRSLAYRELQRLVSASRAGTAVWERAIAGLKRDGRIAVVDEVTKSGQKRKMVKLLKQKE